MFGRSFWGFAAAVVFMLSAISLGATYGGGSGTAEDPYQIWTAEQMNTIGVNSADWDKHFKLMDDIDMSAYTGTQYNIIGNETINFTGTFDGNRHTINNLMIDRPEQNKLGLFSYVGLGGQIRNLGVTNANMNGSGVGVLAGENQGTITSCYASGTINSTGLAGGLVQRNTPSGTIMTCYFSGSISSSGTVGGLVGGNVGTITACYTTGTVTGTGPYYFVGGLVGSNGQDYSNRAITACYTTCSVNAVGNYVGSLIGWNNHNPINSCFWNIETSSQSGSAGGKGLTTEQMKTMSIFQNAGWADKGWVLNEGADYPRLSWENTEGQTIPAAVLPFEGNGTAEDPYLISTAQEFSLLSWYSGILDKHIHLTANLDAAQVVLYPIGDLGHFNGVFNGRGHRISNAVIYQPGCDHVGLFSIVGPDGAIQNLGVEAAYTTARYYVGGLAGLNFGTVMACYTSGTVSGASRVGGLLGENWGWDSTTMLCYSSSEVMPTNLSRSIEMAGGLAGCNWMGKIKSCYAIGAVIGNGNEIGGLVGCNVNGGSISSSFWNIDTSGRPSYHYDEGTGLSNANMKRRINFINAGWDFTGEDANGTNNIWRMCEDGLDYPRLNWQFADIGDFVCPGGVDGDDLVYCISQWQRNGCTAANNYCGGADLDYSSDVDLTDWAIFASHWLEEGRIVPWLPLPAASWKMDETAGTVVSDSAGGHDGQAVNVTGTPWVAGRLNNALKLDGVDDYVDVAGYAGVMGTASRTCTAWIKANSTGKDQVILSWGNGANGQKWMFRVQADGKLAVAVWGGYISGSVSVADGQWHHVAAVLFDDGSPSVDEIRLYVDGIRQTATFSSTQAVNTIAGQTVQMGSVSSGTAQGSFFGGLLDEVRIYDVPLTGEQILRVAME